MLTRRRFGQARTSLDGSGARGAWARRARAKLNESIVFVLRQPRRRPGRRSFGRRQEGPRALRYATFFVTHLECRACARHAELALGEIDGVRSAEVRFLGEMAQIAYDVKRRTTARSPAPCSAPAIACCASTARRPPFGKAWGASTRRDPLGAGGAHAPGAVQADDPAAVGLGRRGSRSRGSRSRSADRRSRARAWSFAKKGIVGHDATVGAAALGSFALGCLSQWGGARPFDGTGAFEASAAILAAALFGRAAYVELCRWRSPTRRPRAGSLERRTPHRSEGNDEIVDRHTLAIGDRVHVLEGEIVPADLRLEGPALLGPPRGDGTSSSRQSGEIAEAGAVLLSPSVHGRVARPPRAELASAIDAEVSRRDRTRGTRARRLVDRRRMERPRRPIPLRLHLHLRGVRPRRALLARRWDGALRLPRGDRRGGRRVALGLRAGGAARGDDRLGPRSRARRRRPRSGVARCARPRERRLLRRDGHGGARRAGGYARRSSSRRRHRRGPRALAAGDPARIVSGEPTEAAQIAGRRLGIPATGGLSAEAKALMVRDLQHGGARVLYVHDTRTAVAASHADVAIAIAPRPSRGPWTRPSSSPRPSSRRCLGWSIWRAPRDGGGSSAARSR